MSGFLDGFDLGCASEVRIHSYTVGAGQSAQLTDIAIEVWRDSSLEPELLEVAYGDDGPTLAAVQALILAVNRQLRARRSAGS